MSHDEHSPGDNEVDLARVLRIAGRREQPPEDAMREVRAAVHAQWRAVVDERRSRRRRWMGFAAAASVVALVAGAWFVETNGSGGPVVASIGRIAGTVRVDRGWFVPGRTVAPGEVLHAGDRLVTDSAGGSALELGGGMSMRLDAATTIAFVDAGQVRVIAGGVYVDTSVDTGVHAGSPARPLSIETPLGVVRHLGTQYEVRLSADDLRVTVREGRVELTGRDGIARTGESGERLTLHSDGQLERVSVRSDAADWQWASALATPFAIENRSLADFLAWVARETGRRLDYATPQSEAEARRVVLRGSVADLTPENALAAVLSTTHLRGELSDGRIAIHLQ